VFRLGLFLTLVALAATGCLDVCGRAELLNKEFQKRHSQCFPEGTLPNAPFSADACDASMKACSKTDEAALQTYFDCLDRLPVCTAQTKSTFNDKFLECAKRMNQLSQGCFTPG
jgi:hypothetical protein